MSLNHKQQNTERLSLRADRIQPFYVMDLLARARQLEAQGRSIIHLEVGEPDFATAQPVTEAAQRALCDQKIHYTAAMGLPQLRQAVADHYRKTHQVDIDAQRIVITPGASGALQLALAVLADPGDSILLTDPGYPCNRNIARVLGIDTIDVEVTDDTHYQMSAEHVEQYWKNNTRAAMLVSPSNPTGTVIGRQQCQSLIDAIRVKSGHLIIDEIYQGLVYESATMTALSLSDDIFVINSFSKYFGMTGWRLGWLVVPADRVDAVDRLAQNLFLAAPTLSQYAALAAFSDETEKILQQRVTTFKQRRDYLIPELEKMGFKIPVKPQGAFYIYADCSDLTGDSFTWTQTLLEQEGVAVTPGIDFGHFQADTHVRFAYTRPVEQLQQACERIARFIDKH